MLCGLAKCGIHTSAAFGIHTSAAFGIHTSAAFGIHTSAGFGIHTSAACVHVVAVRRKVELKCHLIIEICNI